MDKPTKILVVDDEPDIVEFLRTLLESEDYAAISAENGEQGLAKIKEEKPNLIISDAVMPKMDGFHLLDALRKGASEFSEIPVLMLTSAGRTYDKKVHAGNIAVDRDADDYLDKPVNPERLLFKVKKLIFRHDTL